MSDSSTLGKRITDAREARGYSVTYTARQMAVTERTAKLWESGKSKPRANKLQMLAGVLSVPLLWLINGDEQFDPMKNCPSRLEKLEQKVERMNALQHELLELSDEIATEIEAIRKIDEEMEELAA